MPLLRTPSVEKLAALSAALAGTDAGQASVASDLLARLTENSETAKLLCTHQTGEAIIRQCLDLGASQTAAGDLRADVLIVLKNAIAVPEGLQLMCQDGMLRPILEAPPQCAASLDEVGVDGSGEKAELDELAMLVKQAWLSLALTAVKATGGRVLEGSQDLSGLQNAVLELCENADEQLCDEGLLLLQQLHGRAGAGSLVKEPEQARRLALLVHRNLPPAEDVPCGQADQEEALQATCCRRSLHILALAGQMPAFRSSLFEVRDEDLDLDKLNQRREEEAKTLIGQIIKALQLAGSQDPLYWRALCYLAEVKFVRRLMRVHPDIRCVFQCLLHTLDRADSQFTEQIVTFLKHVFTGATDQFLSTDAVMFESLGKAEGINTLLTYLLKSWKANTDVSHRGNIVAFLADAMFFSSYTDTWQGHEKAKDLISILFDALLWKGVEGTAGLALGNFVSANGHIDLILDHEDAAHSIANVGWFLKRTRPGWDTKMHIYYLWRVLRTRKGCALLSRHPQADLVTAGLLKGVRHATMEDNEVLSLLECFLKDEDTRPVVLRGYNATALLEGVTELLTNGDHADLYDPTCLLLQALLEAIGPGALTVWPGAHKLIGMLSRMSSGKTVVDAVVPILQWDAALARVLSLEYKREWISNRIRTTSSTGDAVMLTVNRDDVLNSLCSVLSNVNVLQHGLQVKFKGDGETGAGDGHRREFFRLAASELTALELGLFASFDGGRSLHPNSTSGDAEPNHLVYFELLGKLIALALMHRETLPACRFTLALRKLLLEAGQLEIEDMATVDPEFYKHKVLYILEARYAQGSRPLELGDLDLAFEDTPQPDIFPDVRHELFPGGAAQAITEDNKQHYVELLCDWRMRGSVQRQVSAIVQGMRKIIPDDVWGTIQRLVTPDDLDLLICGLEEVDMKDWRDNSVCLDGVDEASWLAFWSIAESFSPQQRKDLLEFVTGSPGPPVGGFAALPGYGAIGNVQRFTIARNLHSALPVASTCFNTLYLPKFDSQEQLRVALLEAVANRNAGGFYEGAVAQ
eukprot:TRINITY_DN73498_c0_g1_i1.p1 TRINITY_DN73498_c0_g1~~TRINITY_DN73498_c0_g1_i1.p1  ORF type:complete len:1036 (+),score=214.31 TRINITY_DN73498_c0_g1_i1:200-3307(+)